MKLAIWEQRWELGFAPRSVEEARYHQCLVISAARERRELAEERKIGRLLAIRDRDGQERV